MSKTPSRHLGSRGSQVAGRSKDPGRGLEPSGFPGTLSPLRRPIRGRGDEVTRVRRGGTTPRDGPVHVVPRGRPSRSPSPGRSRTTGATPKVPGSGWSRNPVSNRGDWGPSCLPVVVSHPAVGGLRMRPTPQVVYVRVPPRRWFTYASHPTAGGLRLARKFSIKRVTF